MNIIINDQVRNIIDFFNHINFLMDLGHRTGKPHPPLAHGEARILNRDDLKPI